MDIVRTTVRVPIVKDVTRKPRILPMKKTKSETPLRRIREQPPLVSYKRQGMGPTPAPVLYDSPPVRKFYKRNLELHAKTFSAPLSQPDIIVNTQIDDDSRSLFNLPAAGWKLPPIRQNGASARRFYSNIVTPPRRVVSTSLKPQADFPSHDNKVLKRPKKQTTTKFEAKALVKATEPPPKPCFVRTRQRFLPGFEEKVLMRTDLRTCLEDCLNATIFYCASVNYNENEKICTLNGGNVHLNDAQLKGSTSTDYYENECSPEPQLDPKGNTSITSYSTTIERCFEVFPNSMLLNFDSSLLETPISLELCQEECLRKVDIKGRFCVALNWIPHTKGCMLFEDGYDKQLIMPSFHTQFLVNKCAEGVKDRTDTGRGLPPTSEEDYNLNAEGIA
ncbi:hypothetical protein GCK32_013092 [Trichostrongylus colubriformis]|uniref:Apple domain-containing protein n=1 Tax=Trichostrongylus colubriformis TaxID=6319 RepID=A0AAN8G6S0_TRICO